MKKLLLFIALLNCLFVEAQIPQLISTTDYVKYTNWNPVYLCQEILSDTSKINDKQKEVVSNIMQQFSGFDQYATGLCETRAHYICLKSAEANIPTFKIWLFAQNKFSVFGQGLSIKTKPDLYWQYHVATAAIDSNNRIIVFDPVINSKEPVLESDWLSAFNAPYSMYFYSCPGYFQFNSDKLGNLSNELFNGRFWQLTPQKNIEPLPSNKDNVSDWLNYMSIRLAANDLASENMSSINTPFYKLIIDYSRYKNWFVNELDTTFPKERKMLKNYQTKYANNLKTIDPKNFINFFYFP